MTNVDQELERIRRGVRRLRRQIALVRGDLKYRRALGQGGQHQEIVFASDYFELHTYLFRTVPVQAVEVGFHPAQPEIARHQLLLALAYLFESSSHGGAVYLLPPHAIELASIMRHTGERFSGRAKLRADAQDLFDSLTLEDQELLRTLSPDREPSPAEMRQLTNLVKGRFGEICRHASDHVASAAAVARLSSLVQKKRLSPRPEELLGDRPAIDPRSISDEDTALVYECMKPFDDAGRPLSKLLDAEAIIWLREYNLRLRPNQKMILVTGDTGLHLAARRLAKQEWFGWPAVRRHVRSAESFLLDLTLQGSDATGNHKMRWTKQTLNLLRNIEDGITYEAASDRALAESELALSNRAGMLWQEHLHVRLSKAVRHEAWLRPGFGADEPISSPKRDALGLFRDFWRFMWSPAYQEQAAKYDITSLQELAGQAVRMLILRILGPDEGAEALAVFTKRLSNETLVDLLRDDAWLMLAGIRLHTKRYRGQVKALWAVRRRKRTLVSKCRTALLEAGRLLAAPGTNDPEAELFVALILSLFGLWRPAHSICIRSSQQLHPSRAEALYYAAVTARNMALNEPVTSLALLAKAFEFIQQALAEATSNEAVNTDIARYLTERAWVTLQFGNQVRLRDEPDIQAVELRARNISDVISDLESALKSAAEGWLRVSILLPLCMSYCYDKGRDIRKAEFYLSELTSEMIRDKAGPRAFPPDFYPVRYVSAVVTSRRAIATRDRKAAREALGELESLVEDWRLSPYERGMIERSITDAQASYRRIS